MIVHSSHISVSQSAVMGHSSHISVSQSAVIVHSTHASGEPIVGD